MTPSLRFPQQAGGTEQARFSNPLAKWEEPNPYTIPLAKRGDLRLRAVPLAKRGDLRLRAVPLAKRGEPKGGGQL